MESTHERRRSTTLWVLASLVLIAIGVIFLIVGLHGPREGPGIPGPIGKTSPSRVMAHEMAQTDRATFVPSSTRVSLVSSDSTPVRSSRVHQLLRARSVARSIPVHLSIPAIGLSDPLSELGLTKNGTVQVPTSWDVPGWYRLGPSPGQLGSAVILGHVDSVHGPAAFYRLASLRPGNKVSVRLADGQNVRFKVIGLRMYSKTTFPDRLVYGHRSYSALQLVTCGGTFNSGTHHYQSNIVVFTELVK